ncbi:hypothetical protein [Dyadobacter sp. Leaf189]|uniref:hypothetical protein n=1 Tax=Dyadobacter sp. Leaf189 TaxID=1736295 RepID=UPI0007004ED8|nr:hypothetical protein [Dyadobacter sp. Leaf189]KQS27689.1 hypothetical protein ASG33_14745 [Dyadobacter sp. Leaf189]
MNDTFLLRINYRNAASLHKITATVESVEGAKIKRLNFRSKGKSFVGIIAFEVSRLIDFERIIVLIRRNRDISEVERVSDLTLCS